MPQVPAADESAFGYLDAAAGVLDGEPSPGLPGTEVATDDDEQLRKVRAALMQLTLDMRDLIDSRRTVLRDLVLDSEPQMVENSARDLVLSGVAIAIGAATAGIGGAIAAAVTGGLVGAVKDFVKSATKDIIDSQLNGVLDGAVEEHLKKWDGDTADPRKAFFRGPADALHRSKGDIDRAIKSPETEALAMRTDDPEKVVEETQKAVRNTQKEATRVQKRQSLAEWMNLLARADLGVTEGGGADTGELELSDLPWHEVVRRILFGDTARGVIRIDVRADDTHRSPAIQSVAVSGLNEELIEFLNDKKNRIAIEELGLTVFVRGPAYANMPKVHGDIEVGMNSAGDVSVNHIGYGGAWLHYYLKEERTPVDHRGLPTAVLGWPHAERGAERLLQKDILAKTLHDLGGLEHG